MFWLLATQLARRGNKLVVITSDALGPHERSPRRTEELAPGITVERFPNRFTWLSARLTPLFFRPRGMRAGLRQALERADVVHMGESRGIHNVWASEACAAQHVPLVWSAYGGLPPGSGLRRPYRALYDLAFTRQVVPRVARFVAQTRHEETIYEQQGAPADRIRRIPLCVDPGLLETLPEPGQFRRRLGIQPQSPLVVCVARLSPVKGIDLLVEAFARLRPGSDGPYLAVVGWDHGSLASLRQQASHLGVESRVKFPGPLYGDERLTAYVDADVFALTPRVYEETSLAALEAAACGVPTVLTEECEIPGLTQAGGGLEVARQADAVAAGLEALLGDGGRRREMGGLARRFVGEHFTADRVAAQHEALFRELTT
jgi:glycosyltransferase involved in cell wall biosynthesis